VNRVLIISKETYTTTKETHTSTKETNTTTNETSTSHWQQLPQPCLETDLQMRPTKESYKKHQQKRPTKETNKRDQQMKPNRDLQKRPTKETYKRNRRKRPKRDLQNTPTKETYKRDQQKKPTKQTTKRDQQKRPTHTIGSNALFLGHVELKYDKHGKRDINLSTCEKRHQFIKQDTQRDIYALLVTMCHVSAPSS